MGHGTFYTTEKIGPKQSLTPEGFLLCEEVAIARTGMMIYGPDETPISAGPEGVTKIFREADEVFRAETIASAMGKSVTNDHPEDDVKPESWKDLTHGIMMNVRRGAGAMDDLLIGDLLVTTPEGIAAVREGKREVSLGYEADYTEVSPGIGQQSNIIINHIALVEQGRCGPRCAIKDHKSKDLKGKPMIKKPNRILDALMQAFKAKDAAEVEKIAEEVKDAGEEGSGDTHIHITSNGPEETGGKTNGDDEDVTAYMARNDSDHEEFRSRLEALEAALAGSGTNDETDPDKLTEEALDEVPEELRENAAKSKDAAYFADSFKDTIALAEILVPGIRVPTFDTAQKPGTAFKKICGLRRQALDLAYAQPATRGVLDEILAGKPLDTKKMTCDAVRTLFRSAAGVQRTVNNTNKAQASVKDASVKVGVTTLAELNRRNAERYKV